MDTLRDKLQYFKNLSHQHKSSLNCLISTKDTLQVILEHLEKQMNSGLQEKQKFRTKLGVAIRENVLLLLNSTISNFQEMYCTVGDVLGQLTERQLCIEEIIKQGDPLVNQIQSLCNYISKTNQKCVQLNSVLQSQEDTWNQHKRLKRLLTDSSFEFDKENIRSENHSRQHQPGQRYKMNILLIAREGKQNFLKASHKLKQYQIMELSLVIDQCLGFVGDMRFIREKLDKKYQREQYFSRRVERSLGKSGKSGKSERSRSGSAQKGHLVSLGLESKKEKSEEIDLMCDEDITLTIPFAKKSLSEDLQRITERAEQLESDHSPEHRKVSHCCPSS